MTTTPGWLGIFVFVAGLVVALVAPASGQEPSVAERFPAAERVVADYPDDAARWVAFNVLYLEVSAKTTGAGRGAYARSSSYFQGFRDVDGKYVGLPNDAPAKTAFDAERDRLFRDQQFRRAVLERYGVADLPKEGEPEAATGAGEGPNVLLVLAPAVLLFVATLVAMHVTTRRLVFASGNSPAPGTSPTPDSAGLPASLRLVSVPGRTYEVALESGVVLDKETSVRTNVHTTTTPGSSYTEGGTTYTTAPTVSTSVSTTKTVTLWVRDAAGREAAWTFEGDDVIARPSHVVSRVVRGAPGAGGATLVAFNHTIGKVHPLLASISAQHGVRTRAAWAAATLLGSVGFTVALVLAARINPELSTKSIDYGGGYCLGLVVAAVIAFLMGATVAGSLLAKRDAQFMREYLPRLEEFLRGRTAALTSSLQG